MRSDALITQSFQIGRHLVKLGKTLWWIEIVEYLPWSLGCDVPKGSLPLSLWRSAPVPPVGRQVLNWSKEVGGCGHSVVYVTFRNLLLNWKWNGPGKKLVLLHYSTGILDRNQSYRALCETIRKSRCQDWKGAFLDYLDTDDLGIFLYIRYTLEL